MKKTTHFERAIFLSWYCAKGDCKFCYMSTQKNLIKNPRKARRTYESILAEIFLCKKLGWKIEFLSGGYESFSKKELLFLIKNVYKIYKEKLWLNIGVLNKEELKLFKPYIKGVCGAVECINPKVHDKICPSKPIEEIENMFKICNQLKLKKAMTIILGVGESLKDIRLLKNFIKKNKTDKITFYRLKPQKGTIFENTKPIKSDYYAEWVKETRKEFPKIKITVGSWLPYLDEIHLLFNAGADAVTKFPSIKLFNSRYAKKIEAEAKKSNRKFKGTLTKMPKISLNEINKLKINNLLKKKVEIKLNEYIKNMKRI
jgi:biotin synthase-like enzyme